MYATYVLRTMDPATRVSTLERAAEEFWPKLQEAPDFRHFFLRPASRRPDARHHSVGKRRDGACLHAGTRRLADDAGQSRPSSDRIGSWSGARDVSGTGGRADAFCSTLVIRPSGAPGTSTLVSSKTASVRSEVGEATTRREPVHGRNDRSSAGEARSRGCDPPAVRTLESRAIAPGTGFPRQLALQAGPDERRTDRRGDLRRSGELSPERGRS